MKTQEHSTNRDNKIWPPAPANGFQGLPEKQPGPEPNIFQEIIRRMTIKGMGRGAVLGALCGAYTCIGDGNPALMIIGAPVGVVIGAIAGSTLGIINGVALGFLTKWFVNPRHDEALCCRVMVVTSVIVTIVSILIVPCLIVIRDKTTIQDIHGLDATDLFLLLLLVVAAAAAGHAAYQVAEWYVWERATWKK